MRVKQLLPPLAFLALGILLGWVFFHPVPAHALPEYAERTGEACGTCHLNPAGGGPRTDRGMLWVASGKPDVVPELPGGEGSGLAPGMSGGPAGLFVTLQCASCHAPDGSGGLGPPLNTGELDPETIQEIVRNGNGAMPAFSTAQVSDSQLNQLIGYIQGLGAAPAGAPVEILACGDK